MPRAPILQRRSFFDFVRRDSQSRIQLDWNAVDTELGLMVEPRQFALNVGVDGVVRQIDMVDSAADTETQLDRNAFYAQYGTDGQQVMRDWDR